jgi:transcriptional regulator with GAF, ATPase, and Fis domain
MSALPRVLVVDDDLGRVLKRSKDGVEVVGNPDREDFCVRAGLLDVTGDIPTEKISEPVAEAVFLSGLRVADGKAEQAVEETLAAVRRGWEKWPRWALTLLDLHFKTGPLKSSGVPAGRPEDRDPQRYFGLMLLEQLRKDARLRDVPVVILSAMERERIEERFSKAASDFVDKSAITKAKLAELLLEHGLLEDDRIIGMSVPMLTCLREARIRARRGNDNILLLGESGSGKELIANYIHRQSPNCSGPFITVFVSAIPDTLIEDELFGHERGAFTDGRAARLGAARIANGGTLFLDEFGDMSPSVQTKLLRLLDKNIREVRAIGSGKGEKVKLQVLMATNRVDLLAGEDFRADLLARVKVSDPICVPPLREHKEDIRPLALYFVRKYEAEFKAQSREISDTAWSVLMEHDWPDNVRGLERVIEQAVYKWKGLRALVPEQLNISSKIPHLVSSSRRAAVEPQKAELSSVAPTLTEEKKKAAPRLQEVISVLQTCEVDANGTDEWAGKLDSLQEAYAMLLARLVKAALLKERNFKGEIQHTPAMRLLAGRKLAEKGEASIAYSTITRPLWKRYFRTPC